MTTLANMLAKDWRDVVGAEFDKPYMVQLYQFLQQEEAAGNIVYPKKDEIFNALNLTAFKNIRVVILGQDPYPGAGQAHGLCFSVPKGIKIPRSLKNIYKEIDLEYAEDHIKMPSHGDLTGWAAQGVLLLNTTLTVRKGEAGSHRREGWEEFTDAIIRAVNDKPERVVFLLWGRDAQTKRALIDCRKHRVLEASHPSPLSARRGFRGCDHFKKANRYLIEKKLEPINWHKT